MQAHCCGGRHSNATLPRSATSQPTRQRFPPLPGSHPPASLQVQSYMADGNLTPDRAAQLESLREKMGLPKEAADKILKGFTNQKLIASMQAR